MNCATKILTQSYLLLLIFVCGYAPHASADLVVIVNKSNAISAISKADLGRIFLGKSKTFPGGTKAVPVNQPLGSAARTAFDKETLGRSQAQMKAYWSKMMFSGEGAPPEEGKGDQEVLQKLVSNAQAIGYIDSGSVNDSVKVVAVN